MNILPVKIKNSIIICEYARTEDQRALGLQDRRFLKNNRGMLFDTFGKYRPQFHMKNVYINLEAIFISNMNKVVDIIPMMALDASSLYTTPKNIPIKWVMEVNRGYCDNNNIKIGDIVYLA